MKARKLILKLLAGICLAWSVQAFAWGPEGHGIVGATALSLLDDKARSAVTDILGSNSDKAVREACFWPDVVRKTPQWEWSAPMHYVNIPRYARHYERERDCPDGLCVTEAIVKYANELSRPELDSQRRRQAFAWLCHLVGDLHQPLHTGYKDDLGGNEIDVEFKGETYNLHQFWDRVVIREFMNGRDDWAIPYPDADWIAVSSSWNPREVEGWTDESRALVSLSAYPPKPRIERAFAEQTWVIIRQQWQKGALRLALILNAVLGEGEVVPAL